MKKLFLLFSIAFLSLTSFGQFATPQATNRTVISDLKNNQNRNTPGNQDQVNAVDTLQMYLKRATGLYIYNNTKGGYVTGNAQYGHDTTLNTALASHFDGIGTATVTEVLLVVGTIDVVGNTPGNSDTIKVGIYSCALDSSPATQLGTANLRIADMDTANFFTSVLLTANVTSSFLVTLDFAGINDTFAIASNDPVKNEGKGEKRARAKINPKLISPNGSWRSLNSLYGGTFNADLMMFPVLSDPTGIGQFKNDLFTLKSLSPVPSTGLVSLEYSLVDPAAVSYSVMDMKGKIVLKSNSEMKAPANYKETIDMTRFAAGNYYVTFNAGAKTITQKMVIAK